MKTHLRPNLTGYILTALWFLLTIAPVRSEGIAGDLAAPIAAALAAEGVPATATLQFERSVALPDGFFTDGALVENVAFARDTGRFVIRFRSGESFAAIAGEAGETIPVPVLTSDLAANEIIAQDDLAWVDMSQRIASLYLLNPEEIIGLSTRRPLKANTALRKSDIAAEIAVEKGEIVTLTVETPGMRLSNQGVALARGAIGDLIDVKNLNSSRIISAVIIAKGVARAAGSTAPASGANRS